MTVVTGVSGSGKSSLAFDTIYAEGQRRYVESLSAYARQFLERMDKPDVDEIQASLRPSRFARRIRRAIRVRPSAPDRDLRLPATALRACRTTYCRVCGRLVTRDSPESIADEVLTQLPEGTRFYVLFPASAGSERSGS